MTPRDDFLPEIVLFSPVLHLLQLILRRGSHRKVLHEADFKRIKLEKKGNRQAKKVLNPFMYVKVKK